MTVPAPRSCAVDREAAVVPRQEVAHGLLPDETMVHEHPQHLGAKEAFEVAGVEARQVVEASIGAKATRMIGLTMESSTRGATKSNVSFAVSKASVVSSPDSTSSTSCMQHSSTLHSSSMHCNSVNRL